MSGQMLPGDTPVHIVRTASVPHPFRVRLIPSCNGCTGLTPGASTRSPFRLPLTSATRFCPRPFLEPSHFNLSHVSWSGS
jgi:hypothetical protein